MVGQTGSGGVGIGQGGAFGTRFGAYRDLLEQSVARRWHTAGVDPRLQTAPPVIVTFVIRRDGSSSDVRLEQSSGDKALDYSAQRAIYEASPFPPLPAQYERNDARIEFWFQLKMKTKSLVVFVGAVALVAFAAQQSDVTIKLTQGERTGHRGAGFPRIG